MYTDTILFIIGAAGSFAAVISLVYLIGLLKKHKKNIQNQTDLSDMDKNFVLTEWESFSTGREATEYVPHTPETKQKNAFSEEALEGLYVIEKTIYSGPMSQVFLARSLKLNNKCIIKFVTHEIGNVSYEHDKLKNLYHTGLPKIIDIFTDENGIYLVESYIEGKTLGETIKETAESKKAFTPRLIADWAKQLCDVYSYLHNLPDSPIYHFDIKPDNIMVTHGERLVPIDFGISKRQNDKSRTIAAVSPKYAAPEQFGKTPDPKYKKIMDLRFGQLPVDFINREPDARTDIFSIGAVLFELATGEVPTIHNLSKLKEALSASFAEIILRCLKTEPDKRYQSIDEISADLQKLSDEKPKIQRSVLIRRLTAVMAAVFFILSGSSFVYGGYIYNRESGSTIDARPQYITLSLQQTSELKIEKQMPDGKVANLGTSDLSWDFGADGVVQIDGNRILGLNLGEAVIEGRYRNKRVSLVVNVVEAMEGGVDIALRYEFGHKTALFGGSLEREHIDGSLDREAEFVSPEGMDIASDGTIYFADSGVLRKITGNTVKSIEIEPAYIVPRVVRCCKNEVYITTGEWEDTNGNYNYGIAKISEEGFAQDIYSADASYTAIEDFGFSPVDESKLYFIERNAGMGEVYLKVINLNDTEDIYTASKLPEGTRSLCFDGDGAVYLANPEKGIIQCYKNGELKFFAGSENNRAFIDGTLPLFYMPQKLKYSDGLLYVWDFNVLRIIKVENNTAIDCMTLAGEASPECDLENIQSEYDAESVIFPGAYFTDFAISGESIILTDPKRGLIWKIFL